MHGNCITKQLVQEGTTPLLSLPPLPTFACSAQNRTHMSWPWEKLEALFPKFLLEYLQSSQYSALGVEGSSRARPVGAWVWKRICILETLLLGLIWSLFLRWATHPQPPSWPACTPLPTPLECCLWEFLPGSLTLALSPVLPKALASPMLIKQLTLTMFSISPENWLPTHLSLHLHMTNGSTVTNKFSKSCLTSSLRPLVPDE